MDQLPKICLVTMIIEEKKQIKMEMIYEIINDNQPKECELYFLDTDNEKYIGSKLIVDKTMKILIEIPMQVGKYTLKLESNGIVYDTILLDNKGEPFITAPNEYKVFTKKNAIQVMENGKIEISNRKIGDKLRNEVLKQRCSKKVNGKFCLLRLLKGKEKYYLFNDRILYGDDNAEQLFRYINENHKKMAKYCYFVIDKTSDRIPELKKVGKVLKYGSLKHKMKYLNAKMILSSHASYYDRVYNPFNNKEMEFYKELIHKKFIFLQHGVCMNDVHTMLQRSHTIADLFITTTNKEYEDIKSEVYMYEEGVVVCTGLPRFDKLVDKRKKIILISPTWRAYLTDVEYTNDKNNRFATSKYFKVYSSLLQNEKLLGMIRERGYEIKFLLHPAFQEYKEYFLNFNGKNVKVILTQDIKYSDLFNECSIFITDYSSIHFDVAFLKKPIIYYQFDKNKFFESHYSKGYYDYEKDGFGEVIEKEDELIRKIEYYLQHNCQIEEKYNEKIENTFRYLNRENAARVYQEMLKLDKKTDEVYRFNNIS